MASARLESAQRMADRFGARAYADPAGLIDEVDVVHICSPNGTHAAHAAAAITRGKHVVCEKPLTTSPEDADRLTALADRAGVVAVVPFVYRYHPMAHELRARIARGDGGNLVSVTGEYLQDWRLGNRAGGWWTDPQQSGPSRVWADIGSHVADLVQFATGQSIASVSAVTRQVEGTSPDGRALATEDVAYALIELEDGTPGTLAVSQMALGRKNGLVLRIDGTSAAFSFEQEHPDSLWIGKADHNLVVTRQAAALTDAAAQLSIVPAGHPMGYQDAFTALITDAYRAVAGQQPVGVLPTFADGARLVHLTDAVLRSAESRSWTAVTSGALA